LELYHSRVIALPTLFGRSRVLDHIVLAQSAFDFQISSGLILVFSGAFLRDPRLQLIEFVVGAVFLLAASLGQKRFAGLLMAAAAHSVVEFGFRIPLANWPILLKAVAAYAALRKPNASATVPSPGSVDDVSRQTK
jgi:hypothetical protein